MDHNDPNKVFDYYYDDVIEKAIHHNLFVKASSTIAPVPAPGALFLLGSAIMVLWVVSKAR